MEPTEQRSSTYSEAQRRYYQAHRDEILAKYKEKKPWLSYYERHKEELKQKALARYYAKKGVASGVPPPTDGHRDVV